MLGTRLVRLPSFAGFFAGADSSHLSDSHPDIGLASEPLRDRLLTRILPHVLCTASAVLAAAVLARAMPPSSSLLSPPLLLGGWMALVAAIEIARHAFTRRFRTGEDVAGFTSALAVALDGVDPYTRRHSARVAEYAERLARGLGLVESEVRMIRLAGLLHDVGKVAQERALLQKNGPLDAEERLEIECHPAAGAEILGRVRALRDVAVLVRHHHERPDGRGYPGRLKGEEIPLGSRVVLVADAFDAMTSDRPYRRGMSGERAVAELAHHAGTQFDRRVVAALASLQARGRFEIAVDSEGGPAPSAQAHGWIGDEQAIQVTP